MPWQSTALLVTCVLLIFLWMGSKYSRAWLEKANPLFSLLASVVALSVFIQFYLTARTERLANEQAKLEQRARFNAQISSLAAELVNNIEVCKLILQDPEPAEPKIFALLLFRFQTTCTDAALESGIITHHKLRARLILIMQRAKSMNHLLDQADTLANLGFTLAPEYRIQAEQRVRQIIVQAKEEAPKTQEIIAQTQPLFEEFWKESDKFRDEVYQREQLAPEGRMP